MWGGGGCGGRQGQSIILQRIGLPHRRILLCRQIQRRISHRLRIQLKTVAPAVRALLDIALQNIETHQTQLIERGASCRKAKEIMIRIVFDHKREKKTLPPLCPPPHPPVKPPKRQHTRAPMHRLRPPVIATFHQSSNPPHTHTATASSSMRLHTPKPSVFCPISDHTVLTAFYPRHRLCVF